MSNYFGKNPVSECGRYNRSPKKKIKLPCLAVVQVYIKFMGGLDKADILISLHKAKCKTKKWYHWIFFHLLTLSIVNAWIIYREIGGNGTLLDFIIRTSRCLISATSDSNDEIQELPQKRRSGIRANQVPDDIQYDVKNHGQLQIDGTTQRCKQAGCSCRSRFMCSKCQIVLCIVGSKCFLEFHGQIWVCFLILEILDTKSHNYIRHVLKYCILYSSIKKFVINIFSLNSWW